MPKKPPPLDSTGPMGMQPVARSPTADTQMLPMMPGANAEKKEMKDETQEPPPTRAEAVRAAQAEITRRNSLRKQRDAQKSQRQASARTP